MTKEEMLNAEIKSYTTHGNLDRPHAIGRLFLRKLSENIWFRHVDSLWPDESPPFQEIMKEIDAYEITDAWFDERNYLYIQTSRPGVLIGVKGSNIELLTEDFTEYAKTWGLKFSGIKIKEDKYPLREDLHKCLISYSLMLSDPDY